MEEQKLIRRKNKALNENNKSVLLTACTELANIYFNKGSFEKAIEEYKIISKLYKGENKLINYAQANRGIGEAYLGLKQYEEALKYQNIYLTITKSEKNKLEEQRALATIGHTYLTWFLDLGSNENHLELAYKNFMKSLLVCESLSDVTKIEKMDMSARLFANLGVVKECQENYAQALELINKSIGICKQYDLYEQLYRGYLSMAALYEKQKDFKEAIHNYNLAIETAKKFKDKVDLTCGALLAKSESLIKVGDYQGAKQSLMKGYKLKSPIQQDRDIIEKNLKLVALMCRTEDKLVILTDNYQMKKLYEKMGDYACDLKIFDKAIEYYLKMLQLAEKSGVGGKELGSCYYSLAETYRDNGQFDKAVEYFEKEHSLCKDRLKESLNTLCHIADTKEQANCPANEVKSIYERAINQCKEKKNSLEEYRILSRYLDYLRRIGDNTEAYIKQQNLSNLETENANIDQDSTSESEDENDNSLEDEIRIEDITDISDDSDDDVNKNDKQEVMSLRRKPKRFIVKKNAKGESQLHTACISGNYTVVRHLVEQGHPINIRDNCGWLPIHEACICGHMEIVKLLLDKGAPINDRGGTHCRGVTPLHDAAYNGHLEIMQLLLERGASPIVITDDGESVLDILTEWKKKNDLNDEETVLFNTVTKKISEALNKSCHQTKVQQKVSPIHKIGKENQYEPKLSLRKHYSLEDLDIDNPKPSQNGSEQYRNVMNALKAKPAPVQENKAVKNKKPAIEDMSFEDWLEDDLGEQRSKRRKTDPMNKISPLQKSSSQSQTKTLMEFDINDFDLEERWETTSASHNSKKRRSQGSLLESGFTRSKTPTNTFTRNRSDSFGKKIKQQRLDTFGIETINVESDLATTSNTNTVSPKKDTFQPTQSISNDPTLFVDIRIEGRLYRVPLLLSQIHTHTIKWLAEQAAQRYASKEFIKPTLELETKSGAILADEDFISLLFPMGSTQSESLEARVVKRSLPPLSERYKEACIYISTDPDEELSKLVEEISITANLSFRGFLSKSLTPFCKALNHQSNLLELNLSGNFLNTDSIQMLCLSLGTLENLQTLNLTATNLSTSQLALISETVSSIKLKVSNLILNDNLLKNESIPHLEVIASNLSLITLELSGIGLNSDKAPIRFSRSLNKLQYLNISDNRLQNECIINFLKKCDMKILKKLNLSRNNSKSNLLNEIVSMCKEEISLTELYMDHCNVCDMEVYDLLKVALSLKTVDFSYSPLTGISLRRFMEHSSLLRVSLIGCTRICKYLDSSFSLKDYYSTNDLEKHLKLYYDSEENCQIIINMFKGLENNLTVVKTDNFVSIVVK